jgi:hypothetical protein
MHSTRIAVVFSFAFLGLLALSPKTSHAGYTQNWISCSKNADGSGQCQGTFAGFRNHSDPYAWVSFNIRNTGLGSFMASLNSRYYACTAYSTGSYAAVGAIWPSMMATHEGFVIYWDAAGTCTFALADNASYSP